MAGTSGSSSKHKAKKKDKRKREEAVQVLKHLDTFYGQAPPGLVQEEKEHPEDCIPDCPENKQAREFLSRAPTRGLWMPLGKEVKVMKCWRCKAYGHRTGDRECPLFVTGNAAIEKFRYIHEDPMHNFISESRKAEKLERVEQLKALLEASDSDSSTSTSSSSSQEKRRKKGRKNCSKSDSSSSSSSSFSKEKHKRRKKKANRSKSKKKRKS